MVPYQAVLFTPRTIWNFDDVFSCYLWQQRGHLTDGRKGKRRGREEEGKGGEGRGREQRNKGRKENNMTNLSLI